jgi:hypothetical protein
LVSAALVLATAAGAGEIDAPRFIVSQVNWAAAATTLADHGIEPPAEEFARLNARTGERFPGIAKSSVPVLLPAEGDSPFQSTFFLAGPAGYSAAFRLAPGNGEFNLRFTKPVEVEITGAAFVYALDGPSHEEVFPVPDLQDSFPGIRRILRDAHVRYAFTRFGVPYVVTIQCYDRPPSPRYLACREADPVAAKFLRLLRTAGGSPSPIATPRIDLARPPEKSPDFTYYPPGDLIPNTGWRKQPGRADDHVYAHMRFPIARAPAYVKSQSFMPWGDCYRSGHSGRLGKKGARYACEVNGLPLVFDESAAVNFTYPWHDNFCELRNFLVGQCPGGHGHQGEDIRPADCVLRNENADRCEPYQHDVAAVRDGRIWRNPGALALYIVVNTPDDLVRFRYLHMNPKLFDRDGFISGRDVHEGEIIGKVATWGRSENGTSYHLHFNIQVFTESGWAWVNPYMTLVLAYERMIGAHGTELDANEPAPPVPAKPPRIAPPPVPLPPAAPSILTGRKTQETAAKKAKPHEHPVRKKSRHKRHH